MKKRIKKAASQKRPLDDFQKAVLAAEKQQQVKGGTGAVVLDEAGNIIISDLINT